MMKEKNITEIIPKQKYRIDIESGRRYDGTRNRIVKYAKNLTEAKAIRDDILYEIRNKKLKPNSNITFYDFSKLWLKDYVEVNVKPSTASGYKGNLNAYILPVFKDYKLSEIKSYHLERFYNDLKKRTTHLLDSNGMRKKLSSTTIQKVHRQLSLMFNTAIKWDFLDINPCTKVMKPPTQASPEMDFYSEKEINEILDCLENEALSFKIAIYMLIFGGFRRGELLGLHWEDINFETCMVSIKRNLINIRHRGVIEDTTKTLKSVREVLLPKNIFDLLSLYKTAQENNKRLLKDNWKDSPYVFKSEFGGFINPERLTDKWNRFLKKYKLRKLRLHDLRHTSATFLISKGIPIATVSKRLGHSNIYTTLNIYTHSVNDDEITAIDVINENFFK